jgi:lipid-A-disaccharide synthase
MPDPTIFISAGEASGEAYGAMLLTELKSRLGTGRRVLSVGMGGQRMVAAGLDRIVRAEDMAVMGITEVVRHLPRIYREFRRLKRAIRERQPSLAILIDFPDIHFKLAEEFHRLGIPVLFFVSPQLWAWKKHRIKLVQRYIDRMLVIFPFEEPFYRERGVDAEFVGHPLADLPLPTVSREQFAHQHSLDPAQHWIALLPGSRAKEIRSNLPEMLAAAQILSKANPGIEFIVPLAPTLRSEHKVMVDGIIHDHAPGRAVSVRITNEARASLLHARASIVASGTATVEAALIGNPFVVVYRVSPITYAIAKRVVTVPHVAMANLIAGKRVVPELIQHDCTASNIVRELQSLLPDGGPRQSMMQELQRIRALLAGPGKTSGAIGRVADIALGMLGIASPVTESMPF